MDGSGQSHTSDGKILTGSQLLFRVDHMPSGPYSLFSSFLTIPFCSQMDKFSFYTGVASSATQVRITLTVNGGAGKGSLLSLTPSSHSNRRRGPCDFVRGTTDGNRPPWPELIVTICMSYLTTGVPGKEHGTNKLSPTGRIQEGSKGERTPVNMSYQPPRILLAGIHLG